MSKRNILPLLLLCCFAAAHAADPVVSTKEILDAQKSIRSDLDKSAGRFKDMPEVKRQRIAADQTKLFALLEGKETTAELNPQQLTEASNLQQSIHAAIANREDERLVCERIRQTGSNMTTRVCKSVAQIKADHEASRDAMRANPGIQRWKPAGGQ